MTQRPPLGDPENRDHPQHNHTATAPHYGVDGAYLVSPRSAAPPSPTFHRHTATLAADPQASPDLTSSALNTPTAALHTPTAALHTPTAALHTPTTALHTPTAALHTPTTALHTPTTALHTPTAALHTPTAALHTPTAANSTSISHSRPSRHAALCHSVLQKSTSTAAASRSTAVRGSSALHKSAPHTETQNAEHYHSSRNHTGATRRRHRQVPNKSSKVPKRRAPVNSGTRAALDSAVHRALSSSSSSGGSGGSSCGAQRGYAPQTSRVDQRGGARSKEFERRGGTATYWLSLDEWVKLQGAVATWLLFRQQQNCSYDIDWKEISFAVDMPHRQCEFIWWNCDVKRHYRATLGYIVVDWDKRVQPRAVPDALLHSKRAASFIGAVQDRVGKLMASVGASAKAKPHSSKSLLTYGRNSTATRADARVPNKLTKRRRIDNVVTTPDHPTVAIEPNIYSKGGDENATGTTSTGGVDAGIPPVHIKNIGLGPSLHVPLPVSIPQMHYQSYGVPMGSTGYYPNYRYIHGGEGVPMYGPVGIPEVGVSGSQHLLGIDNNNQQQLAALFGMQPDMALQHSAAAEATLAAMSVLQARSGVSAADLQSFTANYQLEQALLLQQQQQLYMRAANSQSQVQAQLAAGAVQSNGGETSTTAHTAAARLIHNPTPQPIAHSNAAALLTQQQLSSGTPLLPSMHSAMLYTPMYGYPPGLSAHPQLYNTPVPVYAPGYTNNVMSVPQHHALPMPPALPMHLNTSMSINSGEPSQPAPVRPSPFAYRHKTGQ